MSEYVALLSVATLASCVIPPATGGQPAYGQYGGSGYGADSYGGQVYGGFGYGGVGSSEAWPLTPPTQEVAPLVPPVQQARLVKISLNAVLVGIKSNHNRWDGSGAVPPEVIAGVEKALVKTGEPEAVAGAAFLAMADLANDVFGAPDTFGVLDVITAAGEQRVPLPYTADSFQPVWRDISVLNVPLGDPSVRLQINLHDRDAVNDDPIGPARLSYRDFEAAFQDGGIYPVNVSEQTNKELLFVYISVDPM